MVNFWVVGVGNKVVFCYFFLIFVKNVFFIVLVIKFSYDNSFINFF